MRPVALGFDIGTTSVKAGLLWLDSDEGMTTVSQPYETSRPHAGWVEQDPGDWLVGMKACWEQILQLAGPIEVRSVGLCSQVNTHLFVDASLRPLRPAMTWQDTRAAEQAAALDASVADRRESLWGGPFTVDASFPLARLAWLEQHEPENRARARWILLPKDYCIAALTGDVVTDPLSPVGLVGPGDAYIPGVVGLIGGAGELLPPLTAPDSVAGLTISDNPVGLPADIPVAVGTMDAWGSIFGAGLTRPRRGMDAAGTSEVVAVSSTTSRPTQGIVSFPPVRGVHVHAGPTQAGGAALDWTAELLGMSVPEALAAAVEAARDPQRLLFLPHLAGERAPYWNPDARGVFLGLTVSTTAKDLVLAVLQGVAFSVRMLTELCEEAADAEVDALRLCGGGARSTLWNQVKASALGRPADVLAEPEAAVLGAVLLGLAAAEDEDLTQLVDRYVRVAERIEPELSAAGRLDDLFGLYAETYRAIEPLFPRLASGRSPLR